LEQAALGIISIADANMLRILRLVSIERGHDPRDFTLVAYGGAGPLHATNLADQLCIKRVIIPRLPGLFSALGLLNADIATDFLETTMLPLKAKSLDRINAQLQQLRDKMQNWFQRVVLPGEEIVTHVSADLRYIRQNYELSIPFSGDHISQDDLAAIQNRFHDTHLAEYGHSSPEETIQVVRVRVQAIKPLKKIQPDLIQYPDPGKGLSVSEKNRFIWTVDGRILCEVHERQNLNPGFTLEGPALILENEATTLVGHRWNLAVDRIGNLILRKD
jgi:N-methylhydantoinase A